MLVLSGFQNIVKTITSMKKFPILLSHKVTNITWKLSTNLVGCSNGKLFSSKKIIISVPLGVLKQKSISFEPTLPLWKQQAIDNLGFGNVCKILLDFQVADFLDVYPYYVGRVSEEVYQRGFATFSVNLN